MGREEVSWEDFTAGFGNCYILGSGNYYEKEAVMEAWIDHRVDIRRQQVYGSQRVAVMVDLEDM